MTLRSSLPFGPMLLVLVGCNNKYVAPEDSDTGYVYHDTQQVHDSETGDSAVDSTDSTDSTDSAPDTAETGDTAGDTADSGDTAGDTERSQMNLQLSVE